MYFSYKFIFPTFSSSSLSNSHCLNVGPILFSQFYLFYFPFLVQLFGRFQLYFPLLSKKKYFAFIFLFPTAFPRSRISFLSDIFVFQMYYLISSIILIVSGLLVLFCSLHCLFLLNALSGCGLSVPLVPPIECPICRNLKTNTEFFVLIDGPHCRLIRWRPDTFTRGSPHISVSVGLFSWALRCYSEKNLPPVWLLGIKPGWQHSGSQGEEAWRIPSFPNANFPFLLIFTSLINSSPLFGLHKLEAVFSCYFLCSTGMGKLIGGGV